MWYKIKSVDFIDTVTRHIFSIRIGRKEFSWYLISDIQDILCGMPEYRIQWRYDEPDDIDEDELINDLLDTL